MSVTINGCVMCGNSFIREPRSLYCWPCNKKAERLKSAAYVAVRVAIQRGDLPLIETQYCVDCGAFAQVYEHRDYTKALAVDPVCRPCNHKRGPAQYAA